MGMINTGMAELREFSPEGMETALERLSYLGIYRIIMNKLRDVDVSQDDAFQRVYNGFYHLRRNDEFRADYYTFMQENRKKDELTFRDVLDHFYKRFNTVESSFSAKLLHTLFPEKYPTWDEFIGRNTGIRIPAPGSKNQFEEAVKQYECLTRWFEEYRDSPNGREMLALFDRYYPDSGISVIKKIDLVLWQMRSE